MDFRGEIFFVVRQGKNEWKKIEKEKGKGKTNKFRLSRFIRERIEGRRKKKKKKSRTKEK